MNSLPRIAVVTPSVNVYSETFIKAHIDHLPGEKHVLFDGRLPKQSFTTGESFVEKGKQSSAVNKILNIIAKPANISGLDLQKKAIKNYFIKHQIDVVLAEYGKTGVEMWPICKTARIPLVVHFHGYDAYQHDEISRYGTGYREMFAYAKSIVVVSRDMEKQLINLGAPKNKITYNVYGVDVGQFKKADPKNSPPHFLAVGRFVEKKAPYLTLLAFQKVLLQFSEARLYVAGDGPLLNVCKQMAKSLGIASQINFLGPVDHKEIAKLMQQSRAFVQHSIVTPSGDSEGTPNTILEAGACGLPVISTKHGGIPDVIIHNETGFLVEEGDINAMAKAMCKVLENPNLASEMGEKARERIESLFSLEKSIKGLHNALTL